MLEPGLIQLHLGILQNRAESHRQKMFSCVNKIAQAKEEREKTKGSKGITVKYAIDLETEELKHKQLVKEFDDMLKAIADYEDLILAMTANPNQ